MFLGIDLGRHSITAILSDPAGNRVETAAISIETYSSSPGRHEQQSDDWWDVLDAVVRKLVSNQAASMSELQGIGLTGFPGTLVPVDREGEAVRTPIMADDGRSVGMDPKRLPGLAAPLAWMKEHQPDHFTKIMRVLSGKDYLRWGLTGTIGTEPVEAQLTGLSSNTGRTWSRKLLNEAGLSSVTLPSIGEPLSVAGALVDDVAADWGVKAGIPVVTGAASPYARHTALGALDQTLVTFGSAATLSQKIGRDYLCAQSVPAGVALGWVAEMTQSRNVAAALAEGGTATRSSTDLFAFPHLCHDMGGGNPIGATGVLIGMRADTGRGAVVRAVAEASTFMLMEAMNASHLQAEGPVYLVCEFAASAFLARLVSAALQRPVALVRDGETDPAYGAALMAMSVIGGADIPDRRRSITHDLLEPEPTMVAMLQERYAAWKDIGNSLETVFAARKMG